MLPLFPHKEFSLDIWRNVLCRMCNLHLPASTSVSLAETVLCTVQDEVLQALIISVTLAFQSLFSA